MREFAQVCPENAAVFLGLIWLSEASASVSVFAVVLVVVWPDRGVLAPHALVNIWGLSTMVERDCISNLSFVLCWEWQYVPFVTVPRFLLLQLRRVGGLSPGDESDLLNEEFSISDEKDPGLLTLINVDRPPSECTLSSVNLPLLSTIAMADCC